MKIRVEQVEAAGHFIAKNIQKMFFYYMHTLKHLLMIHRYKDTQVDILNKHFFSDPCTLCQ